ncbi:MAG: hypothetical protein O7157_02200 [Wolbachia endosymbiont of Tetragnatha montana]|nr:hypothetical protein [Wolbachia endosymbiont of Tetragnatha montana]
MRSFVKDEGRSFEIDFQEQVSNSYTKSSHFVNLTGGRIWVTRSSSYTP